jgi:hypothetical protein
MLKLFKFFVVTTLIFISAANNADQIPPEKRLNIKSFDLTLKETVVTYLYLDNDGFKNLVHHSLIRRLDESGVLATQDINSNQKVDVDISVDYIRHFPGDGTPFPGTSLSSPDIYLSIKVYNSDKTYLTYTSGRLVGSIGSFFGSATSSDYYQDMSYSVELTNTILAKISEVLPEKKPVLAASSEELKKVSTEYLEKLALQRAVVTEQYIPESVADDYIARLKSADLKSKPTIYKEIYYDWINSKKLFEFIKNDIENRYLVAKDSAEIKEIREAMNCLASSGIAEYSEFFDEIKAKSKNSAIKDEATDSQKILFHRMMQSKTVHITKDSNPEESWKINQYVRILKLPDAKSTELVLKEIYLKHKDNKYLLSVLAHILETNAFKQGAADYSEGTLGWACRIIGEAGDKQYLPLLQRVASEGNGEYIQKYGKKFSAVLAKAK